MTRSKNIVSQKVSFINKIFIFLILFLNLFFTSKSQSQPDQNYKDISTYSDFEEAMPPVRYKGNPIMKHGGWAGGQIQEPCILPNPKDTTRLIMFFAGGNLISKDGGRWAIAKAWARKSNPHIWYEFKDNPILRPDLTIPFESLSIRLDCVLYKPKTNEYWIYYTGRTRAGNIGQDAIGLAVCSAGEDGYSEVTEKNIHKYQGNPILTGSGQGRLDGTHVSQSAVFINHGIYYMLYSYRGSEILPGIRYATSRDGKSWKKQGRGDLISRGKKGSPDSRYFEWKQLFKAFNKFILVWEAFDGKTWTVCMASANELEGPWIKSTKNPIFKPSGKEGTFDEKFVATPAFYLINNRWYLYYQGAKDGGDYNYNIWDMGMGELIPKHPNGRR